MEYIMRMAGALSIYSRADILQRHFWFKHYLLEKPNLLFLYCLFLKKTLSIQCPGNQHGRCSVLPSSLRVPFSSALHLTFLNLMLNTSFEKITRTHCPITQQRRYSVPPPLTHLHYGEFHFLLLCTSRLLILLA